VWTNVGDAHIGHFGSRAAIADAKGEILERADAHTLLICNADDPLVMERAARFPGKVVTFGLQPGADVRAEAIDDRGVFGNSATVRTPAGTMALSLVLPGRGHLLNGLAATAVGVELGVDLAAISERLRQLAPAPHRGALLHTPSGATVLDDTYNSSPAALHSALEVLSASRPEGRRMAVIGEMLELGEQSLRLHGECGAALASAGVARLVTVGGEPARQLGVAAVRHGLSAQAVTHVATSDEAAALIGGELRAGDLLLVKGSRGIGTDRVVTQLAGGA
jgi:UDP-N-acetylmuramoyl-tripeptide--D-alanyl-D-alanine ligase